jgi:3-dehydroquinate synthetase/shikimate kinase
MPDPQAPQATAGAWRPRQDPGASRAAGGEAAPAEETIALVGLSGSGKTSVGRCLAERLGRPFQDLDEAIERRTGRSPADLIATDGEPAFRRLEFEALADALAQPGAVVATGGGTVIDPLNRWTIWSTARVVWLDAPDQQLAERLRRDVVERPLARDGAEALARMRRAREPFYRAADVRIDASGSLETVTVAVAEGVAGRRPGSRRLFDAEVRRDHPMGPGTARVVYGTNLDVAAVAAPLSTGDPVVVIDARLVDAYPEFGGERQLTVLGGERSKRLRSAERLLEQASTLGAERGDAWIAIGGGTVGDLGGTAAALYLRGAPLVQVPTTWLAQADAAIGGKVAVDLSSAKNAAGAFWPPVAVIGDVAILRTLPRARMLDGMAESLKSGLIGDPGLWELIEQRGEAALADDEPARYAIVERAARLKLDVVDRDPFERGERRTLNLGHTIGHALEVESRYRLPHGQAVVLGLRAVASIAQRRGAEPGLDDRIDQLTGRLGYARTRRFDSVAVRSALHSDKKRLRGRQRWILPMAVGRVEEVDDVTERELDDALARIAAR